MAAMVGEVAFVGEERKEQSRLQGALPKTLIARLPVQVRLTDGVPEACCRSSLCAQRALAGDAEA